jgi:hypothetical protein
MPGHTTHQPHGSGIRGLSIQFNLDQLGGKFSRLFPKGKHQFEESDLERLADAMKGDGNVKDGADAEESHIPSAYTYFGQFVDHDTTFDPETFAQQKSDPKGIIDFRSPRFDLDNLYGRGPSDQPYLYDLIKLAEGDPMADVARTKNAHDVPRAKTLNGDAHRAIIGDPRNDENAIVSQLQGVFIRFHNRLVDLNPNKTFEEVQELVRWHYQWIVVHDFLPRIVRNHILDDVSPAILDLTESFVTSPPRFSIYKDKEAKLPVEFSVAAYRLGHSMVRPGYRVNENIAPLPIFNAQNPQAGLNAFGDFPKTWTIDWQRFIDLGKGPHPETVTDRVQLAYKIDTSIVEPLTDLPKSVAGSEAEGDRRLASLAFRNLLRGQKLGLPTGQEVAKRMQVKPLDDDDILIGPAEDGTQPDTNGKKIRDIAKAFAKRCPLWVYILAEARKNFYDHGQAQLGAVGGRIVAEVFLALLSKDPNSFLAVAPDWKPTLGTGGKFTLSDLINTAIQS